MLNGKKYIYPGSFDLFHIGHLEVLKQAIKELKTEDITIVVANNCKKKHSYNLDERKEFIEKFLVKNSIPNIKVVINDEKYLADFMRKNNIQEYIRGYRNYIDYIYEMKLLKIYQKRNEDIFLNLFKSNPKHKKISSSNRKKSKNL